MCTSMTIFRDGITYAVVRGLRYLFDIASAKVWWRLAFIGLCYECWELKGIYYNVLDYLNVPNFFNEFIDS